MNFWLQIAFTIAIEATLRTLALKDPRVPRELKALKIIFAVVLALVVLVRLVCRRRFPFDRFVVFCIALEAIAANLFAAPPPIMPPDHVVFKTIGIRPNGRQQAAALACLVCVVLFAIDKDNRFACRAVRAPRR